MKYLKLCFLGKLKFYIFNLKKNERERGLIIALNSSGKSRRVCLKIIRGTILNASAILIPFCHIPNMVQQIRMHTSLVVIILPTPLRKSE